MQTDMTFGPFVHTLNKGGLKEIVITGKLRGAAASNHLANDHKAVRAYVGTFEHQKKNKNWHGRVSIHIEFLSFVAPCGALPPGYAEWGEELLTEGHLPIKLLRVVNGEGESVLPARV
ncbi:hypothetical protein [Roseateles sp.]|uniref:hypothetical protein n=1 Tax=Roseateles sp. TaxID=1971397 RepID=UPI003267D74A